MAVVDPTTGVFGRAHISHDDKMIVQGPILLNAAAASPDNKALGPFAPSFLVNRVTVWGELSEILLSHDAFTVIKAKKSCNGRLAYELLYRHYFGPNNVDNIAGKAKKVLSTITYNGEKLQWNFKKYALMHIKQHLILEGAAPYPRGPDGPWIYRYGPGIQGLTLECWDQNHAA